MKSNDNYCGYCGHQPISIELTPDEIILISQIVTQKRVTFINSSAKKTSIRLVCVGPTPDFICFEPTGDFIVKGDSQAKIGILLNERRLPSDFMEQDYRFLCIINNDDRKSVDLSVKVKTGPRPVLLTEEIDFQSIKEGTIGRKMLKLENQGAIPLKLKEIRAEGCDHLQVEEDVKFPVKIMGNQTARIPVLWDPDRHNPATDLNKIGYRLIFENYKDDLFVPAKARVVQMELHADKQEILIDPCLSKQNYTEKIRLTNTGNMDVEISAIEADEDCRDWLQIVQGQKTFTLLSSDSAAHPGPTVFVEYGFKVIIRPRELNKGWNRGKISVYTAQQEYVLEIPVRANVILPKDCEDYIGIDFGTTNSVIAIYDSRKDDTHVVQIHKSPDKKTPLIPSVLVFEGGHDNYKIGWDAQNEAIVSPELAVRSIKRVMGYGNDREFYDKVFSPDDLAGCIIKKLVELAETEYYDMTQTYYNIRHAIVTVPANFFDLQIRGILKACGLAGLDTEEELVRETSRSLRQRIGKNVQVGIILDEPSAAALFYLDILLYEKALLGEKFDAQGSANFLVFDYGGGTLDVSVVEVLKLPKGGTGLRVLANKGDNLLGGDSIDLTLMRQLLEECRAEIPEFDGATIISCNFNELQNRRRKENWSEDVWKKVLLWRYYWKKAAEDAKVHLSTDAEAFFDTGGELLLPIFRIKDGEIRELRGERYSTTISRYMFEGWIEGILSGCERLVRDALDFAGTDADAVDYIIHTGRSSLIPSVRGRVRSIFPHLPESGDILDEEHLKVCVARGAAMYGAQKRAISASGVHLIAEGRKLPHSYGIAKQKGTRRIFDEIIPLGSTYPTEETRHYGEEQIIGRILHLTFFQNSGKNQYIRENPDIKRIGEITTSLPQNNPTCDVRFVIDANRKLDVFANEAPVEIKPERLEEEERWIG